MPTVTPPANPKPQPKPIKAAQPKIVSKQVFTDFAAL